MPTDGVVSENVHSEFSPSKSRVVVAVKFDDGETAQFEEDLVNYYEPPSHGLKGLAGNLTGENVIPMSFTPGERIPVRYDPANRKHIVVDVPAFNARTLEQWTATQNANRERALSERCDLPACGAAP